MGNKILPNPDMHLQPHSQFSYFILYHITHESSPYKSCLSAFCPVLYSYALLLHHHAFMSVSYIYHYTDIIQMSALKILSYWTLIVIHSDFNLTYSSGNLIVLSVRESHPTGDSWPSPQMEVLFQKIDFVRTGKSK